MRKFIVRFFALIGLIVVFFVALGWALTSYSNRTIGRESENIVVNLDFTRPISEQSDVSPIDMALGARPLALLDILHAIHRAELDPRVKGISARFGTAQPDLAQAQEIRDALKKFRATGKFTYAYGSEFGGFGMGSKAYYLASAFENIWLQPVGTVSLTGVAIKSPFAKGVLDKVGVTADFMQREEYKSFMEVGQREGFSPPVKAEMQAMVENISGQIAQGIASSRKWDIEHVKDLVIRGPYTDEEAVQEGLVSRLAYADEFDEEILRKAGKDAQTVDIETYAGFDKGDGERKDRVSIALISGIGIIMESHPGGGFMGESIMSAEEIVGAFDSAIEDENIKAIVFRVDSPGGSPSASEAIRRAVVRAQQKGKPVIVSMGNVAASGGYWIAMNGDRILSEPATLTGSIGVISGKFAANGVLQKLGVTIDGVSTAANAGMWNMMEPFTPEQRARLNALLDNTYGAFVDRVAAARKIPKEKMPEIAKGRVWTGEQALKVGLVDEMGGYVEAMAAVRKVLKLEESAPLLIESFPSQPSTAHKFLQLMKRLGAGRAAAATSLDLLSVAHKALAPLLAHLVDMPVAAVMRDAAYIAD